MVTDLVPFIFFTSQQLVDNKITIKCYIGIAVDRSIPFQKWTDGSFFPHCMSSLTDRYSYMVGQPPPARAVKSLTADLPILIYYRSSEMDSDVENESKEGWIQCIHSAVNIPVWFPKLRMS